MHRGAQVASSICMAVLPLASAEAAFFDNSHLTLDTRNFYMNRDFREPYRDLPAQLKGHDKAKAEDWGQGFGLKFESGLTDGPVGFGLDALGLLGIKLDSGAGTSGTGALAFNPRTGDPQDEFSFLGVTAKARVSKTQVGVGTFQPTLPILFRNETRLLPQTFQGVQIQSNEIVNTQLVAGHFDRSRFRDSSGNDRMTMSADRSTGGVESDGFDFAGATYTFSPGLSATYYYARLEDNYSQHYANMIHKLPLSDTLTLTSQFRYFDSRDEGRTNVDNKNAGGMMTLSKGAHAVSAVYQKLRGETGMPFVAGGTDPYTYNTSTFTNFLRAKERSWQLKYEYDFAGVGAPGLTLMGRYVRGDDFEIAGQSATEWERDIDLTYVVQSGGLKGLRLQLRNVMYRGSDTVDVDENRVIVSYSYAFW
ncbi:OprD family porin [Pseudomonas aeruginosa]|nr:OprD family porin [Pseudomonas aeruginosa]